MDPHARADAVIDNTDLAHPRLVRQRSSGAGTRGQDVVHLEVVDPADERAQRVLRAAMDDIASRYHGRPATPAEVDAALADEPGDDLVLPGGLLVVATGPDEQALGCAGVCLLPGSLGEVKKVYVAPRARGRGFGRRLVEEVERLAALRGCATVRLDTRSDLVEARRLYARLGYAEVEAFNAGPYAEHWFAKDLMQHEDPSDLPEVGRGVVVDGG